jgi:nitrate reductase NapE component
MINSNFSPTRKNFDSRFVLFITFILWFIVVVSRLKFNGLVYNFDYGLYHPDGANYAFRTLSFLRSSNADAASEVSEWYAIHGLKNNIISPFYLLPENNPVWNLSAPRILYPILSIPFVAVFGIPGMLAVPSLSLLGIMMISHTISRTFNRVELGLIFNLLLITSVTLSRWFVANITDGLLAFLVALFVLIEVKVTRIKIWIILVTLIVILASITRFCFPIFFMLGTGFMLKKQFFKSGALIFSSIVSAMPLLFFNVSSAVLPGLQESSILNKLVYFPIQSLKVFVVEVAQLAVLDRQLLILVIFSLFCAFRIRETVGILTLCALVGVLMIGFLNGTLGVNFRYQLPLIPFLAWSFIHYLAVTRKSPAR